MDPLSLNHSSSSNGNEGSSSAAAAGSGQTASALQSLNTSADLLLRLSAYNLHQIQQQQPQPQQVLPQQAQPHHSQFQLVSQPVQQQPYFPFTFTPNSMAVTSNSGTATPPNTGSVRPSTFSDRERQIKRRTKTGMSVIHKV